MATASLRTLSPKTSAYIFTSTFKSLNIARIVSGSVGEINAPKYNVSRNVKLIESNRITASIIHHHIVEHNHHSHTHLLLSVAGHSLMAPYISSPIRNAEIVVPTMANVRMAPRLRKKYLRFSE